MTIKKKYSRLIIAGFLIIIALATVYYARHQKKDDKVFVQAETFQTTRGWGYNITVDGKVYIHQEFIPGLSGKQSFKTKEDALKVGRKVIEKLSSNQLPTITTDDLKQMGIIKDPIASK